MERIIISDGGGCLGSLWIIGWLFTIGFLRLSFWKGVLAIIIWPYYLGKYYTKLKDGHSHSREEN